jgi:hypothetical protein
MVLIYGGCWILGLCVVWRNVVMANEIAWFDGLNYYFIRYLELIVKYIIGRFGRFVRILEDQLKW